MRRRLLDSAGILVPGLLIATVATLLFIQRADPARHGFALVQLTFDGPTASNLFPVASPDGKYLAFQRCLEPTLSKAAGGQASYLFREDESNWDIYRMQVDGTGLQQLTDSPHVDDAPAWSPEGKIIAYRTFEQGRFAIWLMDADGGNKRPLVADANFDARTPSFSRDGKKIAFYGNKTARQDWNIFTVDSTGGSLEQLTTGKYEDKHPQFTPDGREILFHSDRKGLLIKSKGHHKLMKIFSLDLESRAVQLLTDSKELRDDRHAFPSPDGRHIVYHSILYVPDPQQTNQFKKAVEDIFIMTRDGKKQINLTQQDGRYFKHPSWSADGQGIYCVVRDKGHGTAVQLDQGGAWNICYIPVTRALKRLEQ